MTSTDIEAVYKANLVLGHQAALRAVFNSGYCAHAGTTFGATTADQSFAAAAPAAVLQLNNTHVR